MTKEFSTREILLALNASSAIGSRTFQVLAKACDDDFTRLWGLNEKLLSKILPPEVIKKFIEAREKFSAEKELHKLELIGANFITIYDDKYSNLLKEIFDPPFVLYYKGDPAIFNSRSLAVVGSRKFTAYGRSAGYKLSYDLTKAGLTIISGLALGLDSIVQRAALDAEGLTVGVLACGIDQVYPLSNKQLANQIVKTGGLVITEQAPGTPALKQHFPARNRIISGLAEGTLVVEAAESSGSLITAAATLEQNRELFAVPGNIDSPNSSGTNKLIKMGAKPVSSAEDILADLNIEPLNQPKKIYNFSEIEKVIIDILKAESLHIDKLAQTSKLDIVSVGETLTLLEIKGAVCHLGGGVYKINIL